MNNEYIAHHGIKGQKWGVRRFQNPDGTRTSLGKRREKKITREARRHERLKNRVIEHPTKLYKNRKKFTDKELDEITAKIARNKKLKDVGIDEINRGVQSYARLGQIAATTMTVISAAKAVSKLANKNNN